MLVVAVLVAALAGAITIGAPRPLVDQCDRLRRRRCWGHVGAFIIRGLVRSQSEQIIEGLTGLFEHLFARELLVRDRVDDLHALWAKVHPRVRQSLLKMGILAFPSLSRDERTRLVDALEKDVPELRRRLHRELGQAKPS
jgi:hypothetical protein